MARNLIGAPESLRPSFLTRKQTRNEWKTTSPLQQDGDESRGRSGTGGPDRPPNTSSDGAGVQTALILCTP